MTDSPAGTLSESRENRRSPRFELLAAIQVSCTASDGQRIEERADVVEASQHGGLLVMRTYPPPKALLELRNPLSDETAHARGVAFRQAKQDSVIGMAVELLQPSETFWGITFRLRRASLELKHLEHALKASKRVDFRVLQEFRDAVDYVRKTAWVIYELQERQTSQHDTATIMPLLIRERIRRATQLSSAIVEDLASMPPEQLPGELPDFVAVIEQACQRLAPLLRRGLLHPDEDAHT